MNGENEKIINDVRVELHEIEKWIDSDNNRTDKKVKYLVSYSAIKACGTIETIFKRILYDKLSKGAIEENRRYLVNTIIESSCNPNTGKISSFLQDMSGDWKRAFEEEIKNTAQMEKSELNSLVQWRNDFAHGGRITTSIRSVVKAFESGVNILKILETVM